VRHGRVRPPRRLAATGWSVLVAVGRQARWSGGAGVCMLVPGCGWQRWRGSHVSNVTFAVAKVRVVQVQVACADRREA